MIDEEQDQCPECGRDFLSEPAPLIDTPGREDHYLEGLMTDYLVLDGRDIYLRIAVECPECGWTYEGKLKFERVA